MVTTLTIWTPPLDRALLDEAINTRMPLGLRKIWAKPGLDMEDSTISKAYQAEIKFDASASPIFDLESELYPSWCQRLQDKSDRCCLSSIRNVSIPAVDDGEDNKNIDVFRQFALLTKTQMDTHSRSIFATLADNASEANRIQQNDNIIKSDMLGEYIHNSLSTSARSKFVNDRPLIKKEFENEIFFDGIYYFWLIANHINPDNGHIVDALKTKIRELHIKDFGWSIISLLTEFSRLKDEISQLEGAYDNSDALFDFWHAVGTMAEDEFSGFVRRTRDSFREQRPSERSSLATLISKMKSKQVAMESEGNWNKLSATQAQILALAVTSNSNSRNNGSSNNQNRNNGNGGNGGKSKPMTDAFRQALQKAPTDGVTTKTFTDGKERHWCSICSGGQGRWSFHKESDHSEKHDKAYATF